MQIELSTETQERIEHLVASGGYASAEDAVRAGLDALAEDDWIPSEAWLEAAAPKLEEALRSIAEGQGRLLRNREDGARLIEDVISGAKLRRTSHSSE